MGHIAIGEYIVPIEQGSVLKLIGESFKSNWGALDAIFVPNEIELMILNRLHLAAPGI